MEFKISDNIEIQYGNNKLTGKVVEINGDMIKIEIDKDDYIWINKNNI